MLKFRGKHLVVCCIGLPSVAYSFDYWFDVENPGGETVLAYGDEKGSLHFLRFFSPITNLFEKPFTEEPGPCRIFMQVGMY